MCLRPQHINDFTFSTLVYENEQGKGARRQSVGTGTKLASLERCRQKVPGGLSMRAAQLCTDVSLPCTYSPTIPALFPAGRSLADFPHNPSERLSPTQCP